MELPNRHELEASLERRINRYMGKRRAELVRLLGDPPDAANVPESFWQAAEDELREQLAIALLLIWMESNVHHGGDRERAEGQSLKYAESRASRVASEFRGNSLDLLQSGLGGGQSGQEVARTIFGGTRAGRIAVNETTQAQTSGGEAGVESGAGISRNDTWFTAEDNRVCPVCKPLHGTTRRVWQRKFPHGPPAHVGCRCWIRYANLNP